MNKLVIGMLGSGLAILDIGTAHGAVALRETIASPRSVVTDSLPPFGMLDDSGKLIPLPNPKQLAAFAMPPLAAPAEKPKVVKGLSLDLATEALRAALDACARNGFPIAAAVVDAQGKPQVMMAAEGSGGSVFVAMRKAATTVEFRVPSSTVGARIANDRYMLARMTPVMFISGGALPIWRDKEFIGAIASNGAHAEGPIGTQDELCAKAGLEKSVGRIK